MSNDMSSASPLKPARILGAAVAIFVIAGHAPPANASTIPPPARAGGVVVVDADTRQRAVERGGSATEFAIEPPPGAACPGDSEHDSWRVQTFLVPADVEPGTIPYGADWPRLEDHMYSLYDTITQPVIDVLTVPNVAPGSPGLIDALAPMSFAVFPVGELPPGRYRIGIACTLLYTTATYWDSEIEISADASDAPGQMTWRLAGLSATVPTSPEQSSTVAWIIAIAAGSAVGLVWIVRRRLSHPLFPRSKESQ